jgi:hypothetical protein
MAQININVTPEFEKALARFMRLRRIRTKSEAIRIAITECAERSAKKRRTASFTEWIGAAKKAPLNRSPRFASDDDLWS